jgi:hypothetical protein
MTETTESMPPEEPQEEAKPLFGFGPGNYGDTIRYDIPAEAQQLVPAEKPKPLEDMTADEMIQVALDDRLTPDIYGHFPEKRADFIRLHNWTPYSEGEATRAIGGGLVNYLLGAKNRGGMSAVRDVLADVDRDRSNAVHAVSDIRLVQDQVSGEFNPEWARDNTLVRQTLARAVFARNSLNLFQWPHHYDKRSKQTKENRKTAALLIALTDKLAGLDGDAVNHLLQKTLVHQQARLAFWSEQVDKVKDDQKTSDVVAAAKSRA